MYCKSPEGVPFLMKTPLTIAIDGPVGAGKSTISDVVAQHLGILHLDTGAMYRAVGLCALENGVNPKDEAGVCALFADGKNQVDVRYENGRQTTLLGGRDVSGLIRTPKVGKAASDVSTLKNVRSMLVKRQQELARQQPMLLDGRDIGTVVLPDASVKIYLTASPEARARRRMLQLREAGQQAEFEAILRQVNERDAQDTGREHDPLRQAEDAFLVDSSALTFDETVQAILSLLEAHT